MGNLALIYVQPGRVEAAKQTAACARYAMRKGYRLTVVPEHALAEAVRLIRDGQAEVLLLAYRDGEQAAAIVAQVEAAGGRVEFCTHRRAPAQRRPTGTELDRAALRMHDLGADTDEIVRLFHIPASRLRDLLRRRL